MHRPFSHLKKKIEERREKRKDRKLFKMFIRRENLDQLKKELNSSVGSSFPGAVVEDEGCGLVVLLRQTDENSYQVCTLEGEIVGCIPCNHLKVLSEGSISSSRLSSKTPDGSSKDACSATETPPLNDSFTSIATSSTTPMPLRISPVMDHRVARKLRKPGDLFFKVVETFSPESEDEIGAKVGDIMLLVGAEAIPGEPIPEDWILCMNLGGRKGAFPGNFAQALDSSSAIDGQLQRAPHAVAVKTILDPLEGFVRIEEGEAMYIDGIEDNLISGRTASGDIGKLLLTDCTIVVPP